MSNPFEDVRYYYKLRKFNRSHSSVNGEFIGSAEGDDEEDQILKPRKNPVPKPSASLPDAKEAVSVSDFATASLVPLPYGKRGMNPSFTTTIHGEKYFAKLSSQTGNTPAEVLASKHAIDLGVEKFTLDSQMIKRGGRQYLVTPWTDLKQFAELEKGQQNTIAASLSTSDYTRIHGYEMLMNDRDRHLGNFLGDPTKNLVKVIDMGGAYDARNDTWAGSVLENSGLDRARAAGLKTPAAELPLDKAVLADMVRRSSSVLADMKKAKMKQVQIKAMELRIASMKQASLSKEPVTTGVLSNFLTKSGEYTGEIDY